MPRRSTRTVRHGGIVRLLRCRRGATALEYGLIMALIVLGMMAGLRTFAGATINMWSSVDGAVANAH